MSKLNNNKKKAKFEVLEKSKNLANLVIEFCDEDKYFPRKKRYLLGNDIRQAGIDVYTHCRTASNGFIHNMFDPKQFEFRHSEIVAAEKSIEKLTALLTLVPSTVPSLDACHPKLIKIASLAMECEKMVHKWRTSVEDQLFYMSESKKEIDAMLYDTTCPIFVEMNTSEITKDISFRLQTEYKLKFTKITQ